MIESVNEKIWGKKKKKTEINSVIIPRAPAIHSGAPSIIVLQFSTFTSSKHVSTKVKGILIFQLNE